MSSKPRSPLSPSAKTSEFDPSEPSNPLIRLRDTERSLRLNTLDAIVPWLPETLGEKLDAVSIVADESLEELAEIELASINAETLKPARIKVGMLFLAFGSLAMAFLLMVLYLVHPEMSVAEQVSYYWYPYIWCVSLGITGLFVVGREAMRPRHGLEKDESWSDPC